MQTIEIPLIATKLNIPHIQRELVSRHQLYNRLDNGLRSKLILLSAPAGFGKTTLVAEWIHRRNLQAGWLSLDEKDNDLHRFLSYLVHCVQTILPLDSKYLAELVNLLNSQIYEPVLSSMINCLDQGQKKAGGQEFLLVLDDYHLIEEQSVHASVAYLLEHVPDHLHIVICSRADPPLPLARLRARALLTELREVDLRFTTQEAEVFLNQIMGFDLEPDSLDALCERTEGWIAGLQMAAISIQGREDPAQFIQTFTGSNRFILDFLLEEVLQRQPDAIQTFLIHTSTLTRFCGHLCGYLLENLNIRFDLDAQSILEYLDKANLFIIPLDDHREWYRYHRLFADLLFKRLNLTSPQLIPDLYRLASKWSEKHGSVEEAIEYAFAANDHKMAAGLITQIAESFMNRSEFATLRRWLDSLPDEQIAGHPALCIFHAWMLLMNNSPLKQVEERVALIRSTNTSTEILAAPLRGYIAMFRGLIQPAADYARLALEGLPEGERFLRSVASIISAACELSEGDPEAGYRAFEEAAREGNQAGNILASVIALASLGENYRKQGQLHQAENIYRQAINLAVDPIGKRLPIAGRALCGLGDLLREWDRLDEAEQCLNDGIALLENWGVLAMYWGYISVARLVQSQGNLPRAIEIIQKVKGLASQTIVTPIDDWVVDMVQAQLWIASGDLAPALGWAERRGLFEEPDLTGLKDSDVFAYAHLRKYEKIVLARLRYAQHQFQEALQILDSLLPEVIKIPRQQLRIEIQLLRALALNSLENQGEALAALDSGLSLAEPGGYMRIFLDEGEPMRQMLYLAHQQNPSSAYIHRLLAAFERENTPHLVQISEEITTKPCPIEIEPLSLREMEVLTLLRSRMTVPEIAEMLYIAESTLRSHVKSIYNKLNVHRRVDAIQRAEELGLFSHTIP